MKTIKTSIALAVTILISTYSYSQTSSNQQNSETMKTYLIEREIPEAGKLTQEELKGISQKSNQILSEMGSGIEWVHSYVTENKVYCVYKAENKEAIKKHAENGGFPANKISELSTIIDPATGKD